MSNREVFALAQLLEPADGVKRLFSVLVNPDGSIHSAKLLEVPSILRQREDYNGLLVYSEHSAVWHNAILTELESFIKNVPLP